MTTAICYLPLYVFCGNVPLWAQLRTADQDGAAGHGAGEGRGGGTGEDGAFVRPQHAVEIEERIRGRASEGQMVSGMGGQRHVGIRPVVPRAEPALQINAQVEVGEQGQLRLRKNVAEGPLVAVG